MNKNLYEVLGVNKTANLAEIKSAYRALVKKHHPDRGNDSKIIIELNKAWEILKDPNLRKEYDNTNSNELSSFQEARKRSARNARASDAVKAVQKEAASQENALMLWLKNVYVPIDRLLAQIINPFAAEVKKLSADPYDDGLMEEFCRYLEQSQNKMTRVDAIFRANPTPSSAHGLGLSLYHCLSQVQDALNEFERYTMGYVDNYLHDGREMLREAKRKRISLHTERKKIKIL